MSGNIKEPNTIRETPNDERMTVPCFDSFQEAWILEKIASVVDIPSAKIPYKIRTNEILNAIVVIIGATS